MKYLLIIGSIILCLISCSIHQYGKGELNDSRKNFNKKKEFIFNLAFNGIVLSKNYCIKCDVNKYTVDIQLLTLSQKPTFSQEQMPPYYVFKSDSVLSMTISKELFDKIVEKNHITKESQSYNVKLNDLEISLINSESSKWLP